MSISIGDKALKECYIGSKKVNEIYVGSDKVWPPPLWSGTIDNDQALGVIATIPNFSANTKITVTLQYVSGTWNAATYPRSYMYYYIKGSSSGVDPQLSPQNPKVTFTTDVYYNTSSWSSSNEVLIKLVGDDGRYSRSVQLTYNTYTGELSLGFYISQGSTITPPVKVTITTN